MKSHMYMVRMVQKLGYTRLEDYASIFRIGIFLAYKESDMRKWKNLRLSLRRNGFVSTFLVIDYLSESFRDNREKSFYFLKNCHVPFFVVEKNVGSGGVVSELEEYKREIYPKRGKVAVAFEKCSFVGDRIVDSPSTVIAPNLTDEKFHMRRFTSRKELPSMAIGMATQLIYAFSKQPEKILDLPEHRLTCQICGKRESSFMCLERCGRSCEIYHICNICADSTLIQKCTRKGRNLYEP